MAREPLSGLTIRAAFLLGFALVVGVWVFAGYQFTRRMAGVEAEASAINVRYMRAQEMLSTVRAQVLLGSVAVRDALLDPATRLEARHELLESHAAVDAALRRYVPVLDSSAERGRVDRLRREIGDFRDTLVSVLDSDSSTWPRDARALLGRLVVPKREAVMRLSEEVQALNRAAFVRQQSDIAQLYRVQQGRIWVELGVALAASIAIGVFATAYSGRLQRSLATQRERDTQNARDLQQLSARLITAQEEERRSIARELHDEVGQVLTAIKVELSVAQRALEASGASSRLLSDAQSITEGALHTVRDLSHLLHPALLDDLGLPAAIQWYLRGFGKRHQIRVELLHDGMEARLRPEAEANIYRIVQVALTNVVKHAQATTCRVYLQRLPTTILVTIEDDGRGFDPQEIAEAGARRGLGLIGIRERVLQLQGTMRLETAPGKGTRVTVEFPVERSARAAEAHGAGAADGLLPEAIGG
jgi:signal transduction histidine kinase